MTIISFIVIFLILACFGKDLIKLSLLLAATYIAWILFGWWANGVL